MTHYRRLLSYADKKTATLATCLSDSLESEYIDTFHNGYFDKDSSSYPPQNTRCKVCQYTRIQMTRVNVWLMLQFFCQCKKGISVLAFPRGSGDTSVAHLFLHAHFFPPHGIVSISTMQMTEYIMHIYIEIMSFNTELTVNIFFMKYLMTIIRIIFTEQGRKSRNCVNLNHPNN